jgi:hypothetical protein
MNDFTKFGKATCKHINKYILMPYDTINTFAKKIYSVFPWRVQISVVQEFSLKKSLNNNIYLFKCVYPSGKSPSIKLKNGRWLRFKYPLSYTFF